MERKVFLFYIAVTIILSETCTSSSPGRIVPNKISIPEGLNITLECSFDNLCLSKKKCEDKTSCETNRNGIYINGTCLNFEYDNRTIISKEHVSIVNSSAAALHIINSQPMDEIIKCRCNGCTIDAADVEVGELFQPVLECNGHDFNYLSCSFSTSELLECHNFSLSYSISIFKNDKFDRESSNQCQLYYKSETNRCDCRLTKSMYIKYYPYYMFSLELNDANQKFYFEFEINQIENMKPATPEFKIIDKTPKAFILEWEYQNARHFKYFKEQMLFNVTYWPQLEEKEKIFYKSTSEVLELNTGPTIKYRIELKNLDYAYINYTVKVRVRTSSVNYSTWSDEQILTLRTLAESPDHGPKVTSGSFYIDDDNKKIRLYWQPLEKIEENGNNISYLVKQIFVNDQEEFNWVAESLSINSVLYSRYDASKKYKFHIVSINEVGESTEFNSITIPKRITKADYVPLQVGKISNELLAGRKRKYEIIWIHPEKSLDVQNYTVFWCLARGESLPEICENSKIGSIRYKLLDKSQKEFSFDIENSNAIYNLGISANYKSFSSGIVWGLCTANRNKDFLEVDILKSFESKANEITIFWSVKCVFEALIETYDVTYCQGVNKDPENIECKTGTNTTISFDKNSLNSTSTITKFYKLTNLQPYKKYIISIRMSSSSRSGPYLKTPRTFYTEEDVPSSPRHLKLRNTTYKNAHIEWDPPEKTNGLIKSYTVSLHDIKEQKTKNFSITNDDVSSSILYKISDLKSFYSYKVFVIANNKYSSNMSNELEFKTSKGPSSIIGKVEWDKHNRKQISWHPPKNKGAENISFYQINVKKDQALFQSFVPVEKCTFLRKFTENYGANSRINITFIAVNAILTKEFISDDKISYTISKCEQFFSINKNDVGQTICEEDISVQIFTQEYCNSRIFLPSPESVYSDYILYDYRLDDSLPYYYYILMFFASVVIFVCIYKMISFGTNKLKAMKDIAPIFPAGLCDLPSIDPKKENYKRYDKPEETSAFSEYKTMLYKNHLYNKKDREIVDDETETFKNANETDNTDYSENQYMHMTPINTGYISQSALNLKLPKPSAVESASRRSQKKTLPSNQNSTQCVCPSGYVISDKEEKFNLQWSPLEVEMLPEQGHLQYIKPNVDMTHIRKKQGISLQKQEANKLSNPISSRNIKSNDQNILEANRSSNKKKNSFDYSNKPIIKSKHENVFKYDEQALAKINIKEIEKVKLNWKDKHKEKTNLQKLDGDATVSIKLNCESSQNNKLHPSNFNTLAHATLNAREKYQYSTGIELQRIVESPEIPSVFIKPHSQIILDRQKRIFLSNDGYVSNEY